MNDNAAMSPEDEMYQKLAQRNQAFAAGGGQAPPVVTNPMSGAVTGGPGAAGGAPPEAAMGVLGSLLSKLLGGGNKITAEEAMGANKPGGSGFLNDIFKR